MLFSLCAWQGSPHVPQSAQSVHDLLLRGAHNSAYDSHDTSATSVAMTQGLTSNTICRPHKPAVMVYAEVTHQWLLFNPELLH